MGVELLTTAEAAKLLKVGDSWSRRLILSGRLAAEKTGRDWQIKREDLDKIERGKPGPKPRSGI